MPINIYPPNLESSLPAFLSEESNYHIYYSLQKVTSLSNIEHVQVRIVKLSNNKSIVNIKLYPDGTIYKNISNKNPTDDNRYFVSIEPADLLEKWQPGFLYKVLMRFGTTKIFTNVSNFATWKRKQIKDLTFSEWSTVMIIKAISAPSVYIKNASITLEDIISSQKIETNTMPIITGVYESDEVNKELEDIYLFCLYSGDHADESYLLENSGWLLHNSVENSVNSHRFKTVLSNGKIYTVTYKVRTVNGYLLEAEKYTFSVNESILSKLEDIILEVDDLDVFCVDNGCINVYLKAENEISGSYVIIRSSERTNFLIYEDVKYITLNKKSFAEKTLIFQDFTIESGIKYKYALLQENRAGLRTSPLFEEYGRKIKMVNFEYSYLYHNGVQLALKFNNVISSFKHTVLSSKLDTLGDKYPHLSKNGYSYYAEFPITGLISMHMDEDLTFFKRKRDGYYYEDELVIPADKYLENDTDEIFNYDLTHNNIFVERVFREKVEEFLNNFDYKLYKSATEGNMIIVLLNVTLTPNTSLGRMIYEFSATAYEVLENTLENLYEYKIIDIGHFESLASDEIYPSFGQISGLYTGRYTQRTNYLSINYYVSTPTELLNEIRKLEELPIAGGYKTSVKKIRALLFELYPYVTFDSELSELEALRALALNKGEDTSEYDKLIAKYKTLQSYLSKGSDERAIVVIINGREIVMTIGKLYLLRDIDEDITSIILKYTGPIIVNYVCDLILIEDEETGVISSIDTSRMWGQINGMFTSSDLVLRSYNYDYQKSETFRIYNAYTDRSVIRGPYGDIILDNTNINLYSSVNVTDIIELEVKRQIEIIYGIVDGFTHYDETTGQWDNGTIFYELNDIYLIDIEADPGTILYIGKARDGSDKTEVTIGPTGRYILHPIENLIKYVAFKFPQFGIINYKCLTNLTTMTKKENSSNA